MLRYRLSSRGREEVKVAVGIMKTSLRPSSCLSNSSTSCHSDTLELIMYTVGLPVPHDGKLSAEVDCEAGLYLQVP